MKPLKLGRTLGTDRHKKKEEDARHFQPDDAAHAAEGAQKAAHPAGEIAAGRSSSRLHLSARTDFRNGRRCGGRSFGLPGAGGDKAAAVQPRFALPIPSRNGVFHPGAGRVLT